MNGHTRIGQKWVKPASENEPSQFDNEFAHPIGASMNSAAAFGGGRVVKRARRNTINVAIIQNETIYPLNKKYVYFAIYNQSGVFSNPTTSGADTDVYSSSSN
jgi:hypothetical protein